MSNVIQLPVKSIERKAPSDKRKVQLWVRIKPSQRDALNELATRSNMSTADFMRSIVGFVLEEEWQLGPTKQVEAI